MFKGLYSLIRDVHAHRHIYIHIKLYVYANDYYDLIFVYIFIPVVQDFNGFCPSNVTHPSQQKLI